MIYLYTSFGATIIWIIIGLLFYALTDRVFESDQLSKFNELIGIIPFLYRDEIRYIRGNQVFPIFPSAFETVYSNLLPTIESSSKIVLVTGSLSGEGKSTISSNLGITTSSFNKRTVIVSADLRKPRIHIGFEVDSTIGLSNYLVGGCLLSDIIQPIGGDDKLFIIPSGPIPPNPAQLLNTDRMKFALEILKEQFDLVILDSPPIYVSDTIFLGRYSDVIITVMRINYTAVDRLSRTLKKLKKINLNTFLIANCATEPIFGTWEFGYGYGYEYEYEDDYTE